MTPRQTIPALAAAVLVSPLISHFAHAQFGIGMQLPRNDFRWTWGDLSNQRFEDFSVSGMEGGFRCDLTGRLRAASSMSRMEVRDFEQQLRGSIFFVQEAANAMYVLDTRRDLEWAVLECVKPQPTEADEEERAEREAKALEKAARERERRRARRAREEEQEN